MRSLMRMREGRMAYSILSWLDWTAVLLGAGGILSQFAERARVQLGYVAEFDEQIGSLDVNRVRGLLLSRSHPWSKFAEAMSELGYSSQYRQSLPELPGLDLREYLAPSRLTREMNPKSDSIAGPLHNMVTFTGRIDLDTETVPIVEASGRIRQRLRDFKIPDGRFRGVESWIEKQSPEGIFDMTVFEIWAGVRLRTHEGKMKLPSAAGRKRAADFLKNVATLEEKSHKGGEPEGEPDKESDPAARKRREEVARFREEVAVTLRLVAENIVYPEFLHGIDFVEHSPVLVFVARFAELDAEVVNESPILLGQPVRLRVRVTNKTAGQELALSQLDVQVGATGFEDLTIRPLQWSKAK